MQTVFSKIETGNPFEIESDLGTAEFLKVQPEEKINSICLSSKNATYIMGQGYNILDNQIVNKKY